MSIKLMSKAWETSIPSGQKFIFVALCDHANDDGVCYPSREKLMSKCSMGKTTVYKHVDWLQENGWISSERRQKGGCRLSDLYQINIEKLFGEGSKSERSQSEPSKSEGSKSEPCKVQNLNGEGSKSEPCYKEEPSINRQKEPYNNNSAGADDLQILPAAFAGSFVMPLDWQPADPDMVAERLRFSQIPALDTDLCRDAMLDFVEFWHAEPQMLRTAAQWDAAFLQSVRGYRAKRGHLYHRDGSRKDSGSLKAAAGAADYVPAVSKTEQKTAWLRETGRARLDGETSGKLKPAIFATVCEGLAQSLEAGANRGAPLLAGLPALLAAWERDLAVVLADDANGERLLRAFAALIGQSDVFPTVPALLEKLPPLLPQFRQPENRPETRQNGKRMGADEGARGQVRARLKLRGSTGGAQ